MGVEEIQKVNALARELMKHGIASTSDEAVLKAEDMLRANSVDSMTEAISNHSGQGRSAAPAALQHEALQSLNMDIRSLGVRFDAVAREVLTLKEEIKRMGSNLGDVSQQVTRLSVHGLPAHSSAEQNTPVAASAPAPAVAQQQAFAQARPAAFEKPKMMNVHTGKEDYKSEDVAIEKIFYFGK